MSAAYACVEMLEMKIAKKTTADGHKECRPKNFMVTPNLGERRGRGRTLNSDERVTGGVVRREHKNQSCVTFQVEPGAKFFVVTEGSCQEKRYSGETEFAAP
jgi:hypothetical protein